MGMKSLRDYVVGGLVTVEVVNALIEYGEPMLSDYREAARREPPYRAFVRLRAGGRTFGQPDFTPQFAAERLLRKLTEAPRLVCAACGMVIHGEVRMVGRDLYHPECASRLTKVTT